MPWRVVASVGSRPGLTSHQAANVRVRFSRQAISLRARRARTRAAAGELCPQESILHCVADENALGQNEVQCKEQQNSPGSPRHRASLNKRGRRKNLPACQQPVEHPAVDRDHRRDEVDED